MMESRRMDRLQLFRGSLRGPSLLTICSVLTFGCQPSVQDGPPQPQHSPVEVRRVVALGRLEPYGGVLSIGALPGQRLKSLQPEVQEGAVITVPSAGQSPERTGLSPERKRALDGDQTVHTGIAVERANDPYLLGHLDSHAIRQTQLSALMSKRSLAEKQQQGETRLAEVQTLQAKASYRQAMAKQAEIEAQKGRLDNLREAAELTHQQYETLLRLHHDDPELVTPHQLARQKNQSERAMLEYEAASLSLGPTLEAAAAAVQAAKLGVDVAQTNRHQEIGQYQLAAIDMEIEAARQLVSQAELRLPQSENRGAENSSGQEIQYTILKIFMQPGEFITQLPILQVGNLKRMACIAEVYEADTKQIRVGQKALLCSHAFSDNYAPFANSGKGGISGTVRRISNIISSPGLTARNPLAPMDRSIVEVLIEIDDTDRAAIHEAAQRVGLQVTVEFGEMPAE